MIWDWSGLVPPPKPSFEAPTTEKTLVTSGYARRIRSKLRVAASVSSSEVADGMVSVMLISLWSPLGKKSEPIRPMTQRLMPNAKLAKPDQDDQPAVGQRVLQQPLVAALQPHEAGVPGPAEARHQPRARRSWSCVRKRLASSGVSVNETSSEASVAMAMVSANGRRNWAETPVSMIAIGR